MLTTLENIDTLKRCDLQAAAVGRFGKEAAAWTGRATNIELREALRSGEPPTRVATAASPSGDLAALIAASVSPLLAGQLNEERVNGIVEERLGSYRGTVDEDRVRQLVADQLNAHPPIRVSLPTGTVVEPKSEQSRRTIALPKFAAKVLKEHRTHQLEERLKAGSLWRDSGLVFTSTIGAPLDERNVRRAFKTILKDAKLRQIRIHDLRHTCASLLLVQGVHPRVVMETLGHSQISLTLDTYSHVLPALQQEAARQIDSLLLSAEG